MKPTLLIMAAGMGSRYGSLKQLDGIGPSNETILDYSIYDAVKSGFNKIVFVIRKSFEQEFKKQVISKIEDKVECTCVHQELDCLPTGFKLPKDRIKPWGTGHAILVAKDTIKEPFACINADDFYGREAFEVMYDFLVKSAPKSNDYAMVGYRLNRTLSESGGVSRGVCVIDKNNFLVSVKERKRITHKDNQIYDIEDDDKKIMLTGDEIVSMNFWGFTPTYFDYLEENFIEFLKEKINVPKSEFYIPDVVFDRIQKEDCTVKILESHAKWFGVTYKEDRPIVISKINNLVENKLYPKSLWE